MIKNRSDSVMRIRRSIIHEEYDKIGPEVVNYINLIDSVNSELNIFKIKIQELIQSSRIEGEEKTKKVERLSKELNTAEDILEDMIKKLIDKRIQRK